MSQERVIGRPGSGNEGNHGNQKSDEDLIEQSPNVLAPESSRMWYFQPRCSGFRDVTVLEYLPRKTANRE